MDCCSDENEDCYVPLSNLMNDLSKKHAMRIVCVVGAHNGLRFNEIQEHLDGVSTSTLSERLNELSDHGLIRRRQYDEIPPRVEYRLSQEGDELCDRLQPLLDWVRGRS